MEQMNGYALMAQALKLNGIKIVYGVTGIPVTQLSREIQQHDMRYIGMHNEQAAGYAAGAEGYITGKPGVCLTVSAPGFINGLAGLANATVNCFPMILISGSGNPNMIDLQQGDYQELDQVNAARNFAKASFRIDSIELIPLAVVRAVRAATSGRPGGVYLDVPAYVLHQTIDVDQAKALLFAPVDLKPVAIPADDAIERALALLARAKKPLIVIGKGAAQAKIEAEIATFIEKSGIPFLPSPMGKGVMPEEDPLSAEAAHSFVLKNADVVMMIGARLNWIMGHGKPPKWSESCQFIQLDVCPDEIDSNVPIAAPIIGDLQAAMKKLNASLGKYKLAVTPDWLASIKQLVNTNKTKLQAKIAAVTTPMTFHCAFGAIKQEIANYPDLFFVSEGANTLDIGRSIIPINQPRKRLDAGTWGTMGVGLGYAIAAATVTGCQVLAIEGDAAFGFSGMELETICRYQLPIVVIVFNNGGIYKGDAVNAASADPDPTCFLQDIRYDLLNTAFHGKAYHVKTAAELSQAVREALKLKKPVVINCVIDPKDGTESGHLTSMNA